ncbi:hypothetical protein Hbl1158_15710 (plasmid) [Halobaculum sp. CBA1158]|uniref:DUF7526 family protein n=1 Tax=Halobaculum sp. CBA1158 TaxID=2904243 RepID=UPI001F18EAD5|nr:hypothetical protein [Halobaculum sp. CBA1158]UIP01551.1 hypothetical protein Hbl1158_15710 [Halobaculum sp. CBA1158]
MRALVLHVVSPADLDDGGLTPAVRERAGSGYVLVCRRGGRPSWLDRLRAFLAREPIDAVTVVADEPAEEGDELTLHLEATETPGVYEEVRRE